MINNNTNYQISIASSSAFFVSRDIDVNYTNVLLLPKV